MAAAWTTLIRWLMIAQHAASYGEWNVTGRRPGYRARSPATTGSRAATAAKPVPSTSRDRIRRTCSSAGPTSAGPAKTLARTGPSGSGWRTSTPAGRHDGAAGKASRNSPATAAASGRAAGAKPSRKRVLADRSKGPS